MVFFPIIIKLHISASLMIPRILIFTATLLQLSQRPDVAARNLREPAIPGQSLLAHIALTLPGNSAAKIKPRLIVLTDMSSLEAGTREPDDAQSMIRLMLYTNEIDIEGLIASSNLGHGQVVRPGLIKDIVDAYEKVRPNLLLHDTDYPPAAQLRRVIKSGQPVAGRDVPVLSSVGEGKDTEGSEWIIRSADKADGRPLWIAIWGGSADLAQALWKVRQTRSLEETARFIAKIKVHAIGDQDRTGPWIRSEFPGLFYITRGLGIRGMYRAGDTSMVRSGWVRQHIKGHGPLGALYPDYNGGDIWSGRLGGVKGIKEGDTPSFLGFIPNGLNCPGRPQYVNWGGPLQQDTLNPGHYHDAIDPVAGYETDTAPYLAGVYRWRPAFQASFRARLDWCIKPYEEANHLPFRKIPGRKVNRKSGAAREATRVKAGSRVILKTGAWTDPDGDSLSYNWHILREAGAYGGEITIRQTPREPTYFTAPATGKPETVHLLLTVTDNGTPFLSRYQRFIFRITP